MIGGNLCEPAAELASCLGLTPMLYASSTGEVEQGISNAGNRRCRRLMVELAWSWLRNRMYHATRRGISPSCVFR
uniref:transposase n=1 Tax=Paraburkholderia elongata TaxID=2675747 RepID=UPI002E2B93E0|nr:transposase [Paraburkholderia elongata]